MKWQLFTILLLAANVIAGHAIYRQTRERPPAFYFFDVGQGDSELLNLGDVQILIDGGPPNGKAIKGLEKALAPHDRYIDLIFLTHPHLDHFGGLIDIMKRYRVGKFIAGGGKGTAPALNDLPKTDLILGEGDTIRYKNYTVTILGPNTTERKNTDPNKTSLIMLLETPKVNILYMGDAHEDNEERLRKEYKLRADVLKIGHHGSRFSSKEKFLKEIKPKIAIIEVGKNSYGHPHPRVLDRLENMNALIYTTHTNGMIKMILKNKALTVYTEK